MSAIGQLHFENDICTHKFEISSNDSNIVNIQNILREYLHFCALHLQSLQEKNYDITCHRLMQ